LQHDLTSTFCEISLDCPSMPPPPALAPKSQPALKGVLWAMSGELKPKGPKVFATTLWYFAPDARVSPPWMRLAICNTCRTCPIQFLDTPRLVLISDVTVVLSWDVTVVIISDAPPERDLLQTCYRLGRACPVHPLSLSHSLTLSLCHSLSLSLSHSLSLTL